MMLIVKWIAFNLLFVSLFAYGIYYDNEYAQNAALFWIWLHNVISLFCVSDEVAAELQKKRVGKVAMPASVNISFDLLFSLALASVGWFWSAGFYALAGILQSSALTREIKEK